jgi:hypothetical protein
MQNLDFKNDMKIEEYYLERGMGLERGKNIIKVPYVTCMKMSQ